MSDILEPTDVQEDQVKGKKRLLIVSDFHCGHEVGLTPPDWNVMVGHNDPMHEYREILYNSFSRMVNLYRPFDVCVANGDLIDGRGEKSGSTELIVVDRLKHAKMATDILKNINGTIFNFRHHIGSSQTPIGRATPLAREIVWNELWNLRKGFVLANVQVRSHVHYHTYVGQPNHVALTTPALQGYGTRYGERRMSGIIDFGITVFDIDEYGRYTWGSEIVNFPTVAPEIV